MKAREADELGRRIGSLAGDGREQEALSLLEPLLTEKIQFRLLDRMGRMVGREEADHIYGFVSMVAGTGAMGGWPLCGSALGMLLKGHMPVVLEKSRKLIIQGDVWYAADILAERLPGPALVQNFDQALTILEPWREDDNPWVRRAVGVAVHLWAKRSRGKPEHKAQAEALLEFLEPLFQERTMDAAKGVGWGLKTLGRQYPGPTAAWLGEQIRVKGRRPRAVVLRKAMTYISPLGDGKE